MPKGMFISSMLIFVFSLHSSPRGHSLTEIKNISVGSLLDKIEKLW